MEKNTPAVRRLSIIGVGLIGGSLARALRRAGAVGHITGIGRGRENLERALELGVVDAWTQDIAAGVGDADMVVIAVPMGMYEAVFKAIAGTLNAGAIVTDVGSAKQHAIDMAYRYLQHPENFVPAHPIAGTEQSGVEASFAELFDQHVCLLTPLPSTTASAVAAVTGMWSQAGSSVIEMDPVIHDRMLAAISHLPHITAFALVNAVQRQDHGDYDPLDFAAGGFRDFTRIASSNPEMWRDIALCNRAALLRQIDALQQELSGLREALEQHDGKALLDNFTEAKQARDRWLLARGKKA